MSHMSNLSALENIILKEKLAALYNALENILSQKNKTDEFTYYLSIILDYAKKLDNTIKNNEETISNLTLMKDELNTKVLELSNYSNNLETEQEKWTNYLKDKNTRNNEFIELLTEEKERFASKLENSENNYKVLTDEYEKLRNKAKQVRINITETRDEKMCKNCKRFFKDNENFNWSCKVHSSQYSGDIWWCCGKKGELAQGCRVCMHVPNEKYEKICPDIKIEGQRSFCSVF